MVTKTERDHAKLLNLIQQNINASGRSIICVLPDKTFDFGFTYSIGNFIHKIPELLIVGFYDVKAGEILNDLSARMLESGKPFMDNGTINLGGLYPVKIINTDARARSIYTIQATQFIGHPDYMVQQVLVPDKHGKFPDEQGCTYTVPILRFIH